MNSTKTFTFFVAAIMLQLFSQISFSQTLTQSIKGSVYDIETQSPLIGATVVIVSSDPNVGTITDLDGNFVIKEVKLGRHSIKINYIGYETAIVNEVLFTSGKEVVLNVGLKQSYYEIDAVTITAKPRKDRLINHMATVSARSFSVEETRRYAGGLDDPARLVSAFAGVTMGNIQDNAIIVRGNSPTGVSWRLEGVEIPTPHHFPGGNVAGGGIVTLFSSQMLANSDFFTGAFPAEYGNALAGVFDMKLRNGNYEKREHTIQAGVLGIDLSSEGPIANGSDASYLFNYRYSTFGLLSDLKIISTEQLFKYQDLSFKLNLPTKKAGIFSLWGIGGIDNGTQPEQRDSTMWETDWDRLMFNWGVQMGALGLSHKINAGRQTFINTTIAATGVKNRMESHRLDDELISRPELLSIDNSGKLSFGSYVNHMFGPRHSTKSGVTYKVLLYDMNINSTRNHRHETYRNIVKERNSSNVIEFYTQSKYDLSKSLTLNAGVNTSYFSLNKDFSVDPRLALNWSIDHNHALSFGYGKHSQMEELKVYLFKNHMEGTALYPNKDLAVTKAHHLVLGYDWSISDNHRLKIETYYQHINDAPGIAHSSYSMINYKQEWAFDHSLENNSIGRNMGIDITFERFLKKNYYYLITGSVFDSKYKADDGIWRNTRFNKAFVVNALIGREFFFQDNKKVLGLNGRMNYVGGERITPVLLDESLQQKREIFDESKAFEDQLPSTFCIDLTLTYRTNHANYSGVWALQVKNLLGAPMYQGYSYKTNTKKVNMDKDVVVIPSLSYKIEF